MLKLANQILPIPEPYLTLLKNTPQNPRFHAEGSVYHHTMLVLEQFYRYSRNFILDDETRAVLYWSCVLHDIGKPVVTKWVGERWVARGHERAGVPIASELLLTLSPLTLAQRQQVLRLVQWHYVPLRWGLSRTPLASYQLLATRVDLRLLGIFSYFDIMGRDCEKKDQVLELIGTYIEDIVPKVQYSVGSFEELQEIYQKASFSHKNALWQAYQHANVPQLQKMLARFHHEDQSQEIPACKWYIGFSPEELYTDGYGISVQKSLFYLPSRDTQAFYGLCEDINAFIHQHPGESFAVCSPSLPESKRVQLRDLLVQAQYQLEFHTLERSLSDEQHLAPVEQVLPSHLWEAHKQYWY